MLKGSFWSHSKGLHPKYKKPVGYPCHTLHTSSGTRLRSTQKPCTVHTTRRSGTSIKLALKEKPYTVYTWTIHVTEMKALDTRKIWVRVGLNSTIPNASMQDCHPERQSRHRCLQLSRSTMSWLGVEGGMVKSKSWNRMVPSWSMVVCLPSIFVNTSYSIGMSTPLVQSTTPWHNAIFVSIAPRCSINAHGCFGIVAMFFAKLRASSLEL